MQYNTYIRHCSTVLSKRLIIGRNLVNGLEIRGVCEEHMNRDTVRVNPTTGDTLFTAFSSHYTRTRLGLDHIYVERIEQMYNIIYVVNPKTN